MINLNFESPETEEYYADARRKLGVGRPSWWNTADVITREDVDNYIKDAENMLQC
ncbi:MULTISPECIES: hypothetical protein [Diplocloster]|uniref:Uncharacterized protein n=2 Tax=Diplocloster TaxID=2918511 RepID=A0A949NF98_9FIRM|nr:MULTISPECIES: hypothetical protein [Lachnospiraceae]SCJ64864.1 Uncharacterised protein [uncultured Clostridium sp.]MBU9726503.1 hypothetical protein [Diplocloster modestus]MBU9737404.1 hypothetical protein [Diplocloster agilis]MBU9745576.1 hypothetical protein [Diplocloster agilis]MCU6735129.1 hypothetical protein [Suonthocola fibrivorans]